MTEGGRGLQEVGGANRRERGGVSRQEVGGVNRHLVHSHFRGFLLRCSCPHHRSALQRSPPVLLLIVTKEVRVSMEFGIRIMVRVSMEFSRMAQ